MPASTPMLRYGNRLTALMWAAGHEDGVGASAAASVIDLLLGRGAAVDAADDRGRTALMTAAERGHAEVVEMLVGRGADQTVRTRAGRPRSTWRPPRAYAARSRRTALMDRIP